MGCDYSLYIKVKKKKIHHRPHDYASLQHTQVNITIENLCVERVDICPSQFKCCHQLEERGHCGIH